MGLKNDTQLRQKQIICNFETMSHIIYSKRFIIVLLCAATLLLAGCKKTIDNISTNTLQTYFAENILNKTFVVQLATVTLTDKTNLYDGYNFILTRTSSYYNGPMTGTRSGITYSGTWTSNDDYSKLIINLTSPIPPQEFAFLNRAWRFTKKSLPIMELAPWGTSDPKILHMRRL
jgi:hypothetical protein